MGSNKGSMFRYYILGGIALDSRQWFPISQRVAAVMEKFFGKTVPPEIHFSHIRRSKPPYKNINRDELMKDLIDSMISFRPVLFGIAVDKHHYYAKYPNPIPIPSFCLDAMASRFQEFLNRTRDQGIIVGDRSDPKKDDVLMRGFEQMKKTGTKFVKVNRVIDTLYFTPSETSVGLQLADMTSNTIFRHYEKKDDVFFKHIFPYFDSDHGMVHGLRLYPPSSSRSY